MGNEKRVKYPGKQVDVVWRQSLCIHIGECGRAAGELFQGGRKPWCDPDLSSTEEVAEVIERCPSGALSYTVHDGSVVESADPANTVTVAYNGPLFVRGELQIEGAAKESAGLRFRAALCRCGHSRIKPYCDNSHEKAGFQDYGAVGETGDAAGEEGGPLRIKPAPNGPLLLAGNLTLIASSGRRAWRGKRAALCRCGASKNKPFCDGSHKEIGFED